MPEGEKEWRKRHRLGIGVEVSSKLLDTGSTKEAEKT